MSARSIELRRAHLFPQGLATTLPRHRQGLRFHRTSTPASQHDSTAPYSCCRTVTAACCAIFLSIRPCHRSLSSFSPQDLTYSTIPIASCSSSTQRRAPDALLSAPTAVWAAPFSQHGRGHFLRTPGSHSSHHPAHFCCSSIPFSDARLLFSVRM
ncbi:hypothetical protein BDN70DRAFT_653396 [Pholiota conissans]|uniref:Uncharacterized protein n=1 Tax=Pholiota conissans TaxID=109636 RepID=A0A9P5YJ36_9AGAR|nr:hypothetical protein BDN70DRAFT_653396 [Pholiota conissans]